MLKYTIVAFITGIAITLGSGIAIELIAAYVLNRDLMLPEAWSTAERAYHVAAITVICTIIFINKKPSS